MTGERLVILGRPGAGKGTQCVSLARHYGVPHISTGDMLRGAVAAGTALGLQAGEYMSSGALVPDELIIGVVAERLGTREAAAEGWLLDGFPRTVPQAVDFDVIVAESPIDVVVNLEVPAEVVIARIAGRRAESGRADDEAEAVINRLSVYDQDTAPVVEHYRGRPEFVEIDGLGTPDEVLGRLLAAIDGRLATRP